MDSVDAHCPRWVFVSLALGAVFVLAVGCGGAAPSAAAPGVGAPLNVDAAAAQLDQAERDIRLAMGEPPGAAALKSAGGAEQPAPPPPPAAPRAAEVQTDSRTVGGKTGDPCQSACPALSSMRRAATQLCALTGGESDPRCQSANDRVKHAEEQVRAHCPSCS
jgi:hypothetical protein